MDILKVTAEGCTRPTQIMYRSNTSWTVLQENLESLVESGFLRRGLDQSRMEYAITERGSAIVRDYLNLIELAKA